MRINKPIYNDDWGNVKRFIENALEVVKCYFDKDTIDSITHYIKYDEYEMAFEILFIEIMELDIIPNIDFKQSLMIGRILKLDKETIYDIYFWDKFTNFTDRNMDN